MGCKRSSKWPKSRGKWNSRENKKRWSNRHLSHKIERWELWEATLPEGNKVRVQRGSSMDRKSSYRKKNSGYRIRTNRNKRSLKA
jgi:hypothetical protein